MIDDPYGLDDFVAEMINNRQIGTSPKMTRMHARSMGLLRHMIPIVEAAQPITGRGVGYKLFVAKLIKSMSESEMKKVYRLIKIAREEGKLPWEWIVDETRQIERVARWSDPKEFAEQAARQYRRNSWEQQPLRCEVWSEKGTIRGVLKPVLDQYGVDFRCFHGFTSSTSAHEIAIDNDGRPLTALYVGDWDPSGLCMSEQDLPDRFEKYDGDHVEVKRIALIHEQLADLPSFPAFDKRKDTRFPWFVHRYGDRCWEIDALDPNELRRCVEYHINTCILDRDAWERCELVQIAESESLRHVLTNWGASHGKPSP
jgi:hypothetical protein